MVGLINTFVSYAIYSILIYFGVHYLIASAAGFIISVFTSFLLNYTFVFKISENEEKRIWWKVLIKTYISYGFSGLILNSLLLILWISVLHLSKYVNFEVGILAKEGIVLTNAELAKYIAPLINLFITIPLNFVLNKFWAYGHKKSGDK